MNAVYSSAVTSEVKIVKAWQLPFIVAYNYVWNHLRRPFVKMWQAEVISIADKLKQRLSFELLPVVYDCMRSGCSECGFLYSFLKGQPFTSQIEQALLRSPCSKHYQAYQKFYIDWEHLFVRSHELSDKVCGFKSLRK